jgi:hypothetical protein
MKELFDVTIKEFKDKFDKEKEKMKEAFTFVIKE